MGKRAADMSVSTTHDTDLSARDRETALRLAALHPADREWMLARLPEGARARLQALLAELDELGFRIDDAAIAGMSARTRASSGSVATAVADPATSALMTAHAEQIRGLLAKEPAAIAHALLGAQNWPWAGTLHERERHGGHVTDATLTTRTRRALIEAAAVRLPEHRGVSSAMPPGRTSRFSPNMSSTLSSARQWAKRALGQRIGGGS
jgi:hypothetical protein